MNLNYVANFCHVLSKIDIVVRANDTRLNSSGNSAGDAVAPYSISYEIFSSSNESIDGSVQNITFTEYPNNNNANYVFGPGSTMQNAFWILTGHPFDTPHDRYWNTGLREGVTQTWPPTPNTTLDARYNGESHYPDGLYYIDLSVSDVDQSCAPNNTTTSAVSTIIDNFLPYIKKVEIWKNSITGVKIYEREWVWNGSNLNLSINSYSGTVSPEDNIYVKITTSEPVQNIAVNIFNNNYSFNVISNSDDLVWDRTILLNSTTGEQTLIISGQDLAGNNLSGNPSILAVHQSDGSWMPAPIIGADQWHSIYIDNEPLSASFTASPNPVIRGHNVVFSNTSTGNATGWEWTFQGGLPGVLSSENPPAEGIFYGSNLAPGPYTATLTISNATSSDSYSVNINVQADNGPLVAGFSSSYQTIPVGSTIDFYDESSGGPETWEWDIGNDGSIDSYAQNPANILFDEEGTYDVKLTVTKGAVTDVEIIEDYIEVVENSGGNLFADFESLNGTSVVIGESVQFSDLTFGNPNYWHWTFEDATPSESWVQNPIVQFNEWGIQDVTLFVSNGFGEDEITKDINVFEDETYIDFTIEPEGNNCYTLNDMVTLPGFSYPEIEWWVFDPYGLIILHGDDLFNYFCAYEGIHTIILDVYDDGYYIASVTKYFEVCTINHCSNGYQDCDETAIDCGGLECGSCGSSPNCNDCQKNGTETGVDCGGSCQPCQYSCTDVTKYYSNTNPPSLTHASDAIIAGDGWVIVPPNGDVIFRAGNSITLKTGFKAEEGSQFLAQTTPCYCMPICAWIPIVITPNGDEINDELCISVVGAHIYNVTIWNRWGNVIYTGSGLIINSEHTCIWDGSGQNTDGVYYYSLVLTSNCSGEEITYQGSITVFNGDGNKGNDLKVINHYSNDCSIFPNPHPGIFNIEWNDESISEYSIEVINSMGQLVYEIKNLQSGTTEVDISSQPKGIYFVKLLAGDKVITEKVVYQ